MDDAADEVIARDRRFQELLEARDGEGIADLLHDDFTLELLHPSPATMARERWLEVLPDYVIHDYAVDDRLVSIDGDVGTILQRISMSATVLGEDRSGTLLITDVWRRVDGDWRLWRRHSTPLAAGRMPGA